MLRRLLALSAPPSSTSVGGAKGYTAPQRALRVVAVAMAVALAPAVGCDNISLGNGSELPSAAGNGGASPAASDSGDSMSNFTGSGPSTDEDGGGQGIEPPATPTSDAGTASVSTGNSLCFYGYGDGGAHNCQPDTSNQCAVVDDAGWYNPADDAGDSGPPQTACHVIPAKSQVCTAAGPGGDGAQCQTSTDCAASFECVGSPGQCRHYCCAGNSSCDTASSETTSATFCDVQPAASGDLNVPVCEPVTACTLLLSGSGPGTCPSAETCAVVKDDGTTSCVPIGPVEIGRSCDVLHCRIGLTCLGAVGSRTCFELCEVDNPICPQGTKCTSSAQLFPTANVGICQ